MRGKILRTDIEGARSKRFIYRDVNTADPGAVHTNMRDEVAAFVGYGDVHRLTNLGGLLFRRRDDSACICQGDHDLSFAWESDCLLIAMFQAAITPQSEN